VGGCVSKQCGRNHCAVTQGFNPCCSQLTISPEQLKRSGRWERLVVCPFPALIVLCCVVLCCAVSCCRCPSRWSAPLSLLLRLRQQLSKQQQQQLSLLPLLQQQLMCCQDTPAQLTGEVEGRRLQQQQQQQVPGLSPLQQQERLRGWWQSQRLWLRVLPSM